MRLRGLTAWGSRVDEPWREEDLGACGQPGLYGVARPGALVGRVERGQLDLDPVADALGVQLMLLRSSLRVGVPAADSVVPLSGVDLEDGGETCRRWTRWIRAGSRSRISCT